MDRAGQIRMRQQLVTWLGNAHAMEVQAIQLLENQARRFMALVDEFYDRRVKLILSAAAPATELYRGERLKQEFQRTQSRLAEMQSHDYLAEAHRP